MCLILEVDTARRVRAVRLRVCAVFGKGSQQKAISAGAKLLAHSTFASSSAFLPGRRSVSFGELELTKLN
eukprot:92108-Rhodomonas_salina.2